MGAGRETTTIAGPGEQTHQPFVHLHVHSEFSLLDGLSRIKHLAARAKALNQPALALTDHGTMFGVIPFYEACKAEGVKPIIGIETYVAARTMRDRDPQLDKERSHLLLLAENQTGYLNLLKLASASQLEGYYYRPRIDLDFLAAHSEGLIATTGCMAAEIPRAIVRGESNKAHTLMGKYLDIFGPERFFIELQEHSIPDLTRLNQTLVEEYAPRYNLRFLATNDVHYTTPEEASPHDVLLCIQTGSTVNDAKRLRFTDNGYYLKSYEEMRLLFGHIPGALDNSLLIAEMCNVDLSSKGYHLPLFEVPPGTDAPSYLRALCEEGLVRRYGEERARTDEALRARLEHELRIIGGMGFDTYFLIVWDLCEFARRADIWWNVRGSGAGSLVAYVLGITGIDPLANGLIFERFLNPGRVSMPDIDLDYPDDRRHEMVEYAVRKYGQDKVAQIITFGTLGARAAIRDVGRAMDIPLAEVDAVARLIPAIPGKPARIENVLDKDHEFHVAELVEKYRNDRTVRELMDTARQLEGVARHASSHAAGVIISDRPLVEYVPLHRPTSGDAGLGGIQSVSQWPMEIIEKIGLLKVDFLGLSTLTVMRKAAQLIEQRHGVRYTMDNIPFDIGQHGPGKDADKGMEAAFAMLGRGDVLGVFQVEGPGMRKLMVEMKPQRFDHIIAAISLFRPGPMDNIPEYIKRMHASLAGQDIALYHAPELKPILQDTYGILVYQEQIIRIAADLAGYEPGEADMIRKAVSKKKRDLMDQHKAQFTEGAMTRGFTREQCEAIWGDIEFFARYGFNKAHAADYAVICCQTAYLKAHYPVEYITALLTVDRADTEKVSKYVSDARRLGIPVAPPSINKAGLDFTIEDPEPKGKGKAPGKPLIRFGLAAIKNAGEGAGHQIVEEREANGPFRDLADLCERVDLRRVGKRALESMVKVGVFDEWGERPQLLEALDRIISHSGSTHAAAEVGQLSLFGGGSAAMGGAVELLKPLSSVPAVDRRTVLDWEKELLGFYLVEHPLESKLADLQGAVTARTAELDENWNGKGVALAGIVSSLRTLTTKSGKPMAFVTLEDLDGRVDLVLFPKIWKAYADQVKVDQILLVRGTVQAEGQKVSVLVNSVHTTLTLVREARRLAEPVPDWLDDPPAYAGPAGDWPPDADYAAGNGNPPDDGYGWTPDDDEPAIMAKTPARPNGNAGANGVPYPAAAPLPEQLLSEALEPAEDERDPDDAGAPDPDEGAPDEAPVIGEIVIAAAQELDGELDTAPAVLPEPAAPVTETLAQASSIVTGDVSLPPAAPPVTAQPVSYFSYMAASGPAPKTIIVEIKPAGNWKETCRQITRLASRFEGTAGLSLRLSGQGMTMDFPNQKTEPCQELIEALERLPGVTKAYEQ
jgi:DNA polymerase-3 subunit alpha